MHPSSVIAWSACSLLLFLAAVIMQIASVQSNTQNDFFKSVGDVPQWCSFLPPVIQVVLSPQVPTCMMLGLGESLPMCAVRLPAAQIVQCTLLPVSLGNFHALCHSRTFQTEALHRTMLRFL